jgi:transcriptional regulator with XRE-family HTH domain
MKTIDNTECMVAFGSFVRSKRESLCLSQREVASLAGISQPLLHRIEKAERSADFVVALKICEALNLDLRDFICKFMAET